MSQDHIKVNPLIHTVCVKISIITKYNWLKIKSCCSYNSLNWQFTIYWFLQPACEEWWSLYLPLASEGWREVMFSQASVRSHLRGGGIPHPRSGWGYPSPVRRGAPHPRCRWGVPHTRCRWGYPIPGLDGGYPILLTGGTPSEVWTGGTPIQDQDGGTQGTPQSRLDGLSPSKTGWGTPPQ